MPSSAIMTFTDPYQYQTFNRNAQHRVVVTARGMYEAEVTWIDLHNVRVQRAWQSLPAISHLAGRKDRTGIIFPIDRLPGMLRGVEVQPGQVGVVSAGSEYHGRVPAHMRWGALMLTPEALSAFGQALVGRDLTSPPGMMRVIRPKSGAMARLLNLHMAAGCLAATTPDLLAHPEVAKAIEQELVRAMIACLIDYEAEDMRFLRKEVMRRFEQVIEAHQDQPLYVTDICSAIGVTDRTLRLHCQEHLGISPHRYLWLRRMHQVRRALATADATATTVTQIANNHGFGELGRFAVEYRRLFGEVPSTTLRRPPNDVGDREALRPLPALARYMAIERDVAGQGGRRVTEISNTVSLRRFRPSLVENSPGPTKHRQHTKAVVRRTDDADHRLGLQHCLAKH